MAARPLFHRPSSSSISFRSVLGSFFAQITAVGLLICSPCLAFAQTKDVIVARQNNNNNVVFFGNGRDMLDQVLYSNFGTKEAMVRSLKDKAESIIAMLNEGISLDEKQLEKLRLATDLDIAQLNDEMDLFRQKHSDVNQDINAFNEIWQDAQPLVSKANTQLFDKDSFFAKVRKNVLEAAPESVQKQFAEREEGRKKLALEAYLRKFIVDMEREMVFLGDQREALFLFLKQHVQNAPRSARLSSYAILYQLKDVPEEEFAKVLTEKQYKKLKPKLRTAAGLKDQLEAEGFVLEN